MLRLDRITSQLPSPADLHDDPDAAVASLAMIGDIIIQLAKALDLELWANEDGVPYQDTFIFKPKERNADGSPRD